jgi:hypothetical protein
MTDSLLIVNNVYNQYDIVKQHDQPCVWLQYCRTEFNARVWLDYAQLFANICVPMLKLAYLNQFITWDKYQTWVLQSVSLQFLCKHFSVFALNERTVE